MSHLSVSRQLRATASNDSKHNEAHDYGDGEGNTAAALTDFNCKVIGQAISLLALYDTHHAAAFAGPVGAHLRHVIEHYDALFTPSKTGVVDYDIRVRDHALECDTALASRRLRALDKHLAENTTPLEAPLQVRGQGGLAGDFDFAISSTYGRELVFVASHALHHYALMRPYCVAAGLVVSADFGKAPSTVAHERATSAAASRTINI